MLSWLSSLENGYLLGLYCSDVSGAFNRVSEERVADKLRRLGLHPHIVGLLLSWFEPRTSVVVVDGECSDKKALNKSVCQGTVLRPPLWNPHFSDAQVAVRNAGFLKVVFANDLNCSRYFQRSTQRSVIETSLA